MTCRLDDRRWGGDVARIQDRRGHPVRAAATSGGCAGRPGSDPRAPCGARAARTAEPSAEHDDARSHLAVTSHHGSTCRGSRTPLVVSGEGYERKLLVIGPNRVSARGRAEPKIGINDVLIRVTRRASVTDLHIYKWTPGRPRPSTLPGDRPRMVGEIVEVGATVPIFPADRERRRASPAGAAATVSLDEGICARSPGGRRRCPGAFAEPVVSDDQRLQVIPRRSTRTRPRFSTPSATQFTRRFLPGPR